MFNPIETEGHKALGCSWAGSRTGKRFEIKEQEALTAVQILGAVIAVAGVVWAIIHPTAKGEGEASYFATVRVATASLILGRCPPWDVRIDRPKTLDSA